MKKTIPLMLLAAALAGCEVKYTSSSDRNPDAPAHSDHAMVVITDQETGCQYLKLTTNNNTLTPRLSELGTPVCRKTSSLAR